MRRFVESTLAVILFLTCSQVIFAQNDTLQAHNKISELIKTGQVSRISIIHVPSDLESRTRIYQQALRRLTWIELSFSKPSEEGVIEPLQAALEELKTGKPSPVYDVRWRILLFDVAGKERGAVFLDRTGKFVQIGDIYLQVQGKTLAWLRKSVHDALRQPALDRPF